MQWPISRIVGVTALLLLLMILSVGCTVANGFLSAVTGFQDRWTSTPTDMPDGFVLVTPTPTPTLPAVEAPLQTPVITPTVQAVPAVYLPFEYGFMAYFEGQSCLYTYAGGPVMPRSPVGVQPSSYVYCLPFDELPDAPADAPEAPFGRIWSYYDEVSDALGAPIGDAVRYTTTTPPNDPVVVGGVFYSGMITLPDGLMLYCGTRAATARTCELRGTLQPRP